MKNKTTNIIALILLAIMASTAIFSMKKDSLTFDELAHIPAGYSYLAKQDYRINPEHPPLIKDIPAIPLLFLNLNFPDNDPVWTQKEAPPAWWVQFDLGNQLLYHSDNNPREIIFWSRLAMIILLLFLGAILFSWTKKIGGNMAAVGVLSLFAFSPTFLAHGRLVNTDVGAVFGSLIAIIFWLKFLKNPKWQNILLAGIGFGLAMVLKFSLILLIPFFAIITFIYAVFYIESKNKKEKLFSLISYVGKSFLVALIGVIFIIWPIYQFHVWNYPQEQQLRDTIADISGHPIPIMKDVAIWMTEQEYLRAPAQYLRGLLMASQRTAWGNTSVFMEEIAADSWLSYFPALYLLKIPLAFHILTLIVLMGAIIGLIKIIKKREILFWLKNNFVIVAICIWVLVYWTATLAGNLNIGIRHLLPVFPFMYILVILGIIWLVSGLKAAKIKKIATVLLLLLFVWYAASSLIAFPHYIPYYNELAGGTKNGYKIAVDSNYDWGQDFYRLLEFVEKNKIEKIHLDYFGGEDPTYWLGDKYIPLLPKEIETPPQGWLAVSINQFLGGTARPVRDFDQLTGYYQWLEKYEPVAKAGHSIFIYNIAQ